MTEKEVKTNIIGLAKEDYKGAPSTLCSGCGHDSITSHIITAYYEMGIPPHMIAKTSGIGCSSKTPAYFIKAGHSLNAVHGRMPTISTGAKLANKNLYVIGVSGDGDTASIGTNHFVHILRKNVDMVYIMENNGVYALTKGQFSATADEGAKLKHGSINDFLPIDCCELAVTLDCGYVARSFAGDPKQLIPLLKGAISHKGLSFVDIISPCVTFNNHEESTKSYTYVKEHDDKVHEVGFIPSFEEIQIDYEEGDIKQVTLHDGSSVNLKKLARDYDPTNKYEVLQVIEKAKREHVILTGLLYVDPDRKDLIDLMNLTDTPLYSICEEDIKPSKETLAKIMNGYR